MKRRNALYVVATPIGNLADMVPRAVEILKSVDLVAAEDTRRSRKLFHHFGIDTPLLAYHDHSDRTVLERLTVLLDSGKSVALISDAGTPLISDPGYRLVHHAHQAGWRVVPIPGPNAAIAALSVAGLPSGRFRFEGFLPAARAGRIRRLRELASEPDTIIFHEAPHRLLACLEDMRDCLGAERPAVLARELTKLFETVVNDSLQKLLERVDADPQQRRGEIVLLVAGAKPRDSEFGPEVERLLSLLAAELPPKKAAALAAEISGVSKRKLYAWLVNQGQQPGGPDQKEL